MKTQKLCSKEGDASKKYQILSSFICNMNQIYKKTFIQWNFSEILIDERNND